MRRDMDLIRLLLLEAEGEEEVDLSSYTSHQVLYHTYLLIQSGLAEGNALPDENEILDAFILPLTWAGHDFLDTARNQMVWKRLWARSKNRAGWLPSMC